MKIKVHANKAEGKVKEVNLKRIDEVVCYLEASVHDLENGFFNGDWTSVWSGLNELRKLTGTELEQS